MTTIYRQAQFLISAHKLSQAPADTGLEVAFAGRSNSGKSSAINAITEQGKLARTSKRPGCTQQLVFFALDENRYLVDLPGYGFAKVPLSVKRHWQQTMEAYFHKRRSLRGLVLMMDVRHPLKEYDEQILNWCVLSDLSVHILLTKADKLSRGKGSAVLQQVRAYSSKQPGGKISVQLFSALKRTGIEEVRQCLDVWLQNNDE
ncbi:MAG: YihA family ribosome biogenesis GTP-binding protein [Gammaproteobacteria bacterium]|nr:YihA family ribosome biogenesis GTP-binding protein [Gammaproteobacteria bacterium]